MSTVPTEDEEYLISGAVDDFAIEDDNTARLQSEDISPDTRLVKELRKYLKEAENEHNSVDIIDLTEAAKMNPTQQIAVHKCVVQHLRNIGNIINDKFKEN